ncbi:MAG: D-amino-acid dehydrogenase [Rhodothermales bacterium]|jgi:D-amino-acid dehydrogenase
MEPMPERADVVVVGGGVIGLCTALELARAGRQVTVIAEGSPGEGTSAGNAGMLVPSHVVPLSAPGVISQGLRWLMRRDAPFHLKLRPDLDLLRWLWQFRAHCTEAHVQRSVPLLRDLSLASMEAYRDLAEERNDFGLSNTGLMMVYRTEKLRAAMAHEADVAIGAGLRVQRLDADGVRQAEPGLLSPALGAILFEEDGRLDPNRFLKTLRQRLKSNGGTTMYGSHVRTVGPGFVETTTGRIRCNDVVVAAGAWSPGLLKTAGHKIPVQPAKGYSVTVPPAPGGLTMPMILMEERVTITPMPDKLRFGGTLSLAGFDARVDRERVSPILREAVRYHPELDPSSLPVWCGFRPAPPDGLPIMGKLGDGLWCNTGHGMLGVSLGPASGRLVADQMLGRVPFMDGTAFSPLRFR